MDLRMAVWLHQQALVKNQTAMWDTQLSACSVSGLTEAVLKSSLTLSTRHSEIPGPPGHFVLRSQDQRWNFSYHCLLFFLTGRSFPNLLRKFRCMSTIDCFLAYSSMQKPSILQLPLFSFIPLSWWPQTKLRVRGSFK